MTNLTEQFKKFISSSWSLPLVVSVVLHLIFFGMRPDYNYNSMYGEFEKEKEESIKIVFLDESDKSKKQIVNTEQTGRKIPPKKTKFLGKTDQTFDRETVAKKIGSFEVASKGVRKGQKVVKKNKISKAKKRKKVSLKDFSLHKTFEALANNKAALAAKTVGTMSGKGRKPTAGQSNDYIDDVPLGDMTRINTKEYRYFGFYDRIRKKLEQFWGSSLRAKAKRLYKQGRRIPASVDRITSLKVTIDNKGNIIDIAIKGTSGVSELDEAAVESFNKAGPFPNPPTELVKNGQADIEWGFVVKS